MGHITPGHYANFVVAPQTSHLIFMDHLEGFDQQLKCPVLDRLWQQTGDRKFTVSSEYIVNQQIRDNYPTFDFAFSIPIHNAVLDHFKGYRQHPELAFENFLCSFNGTAHVSRKLLTAILHKFGLFDIGHSSKNFVMTQDMISGHLKDFVGDKENFYNKFFIGNDEKFYSTVYSFGHERYNHAKNIYTLEKQLTNSFVHLVSDTLATSYYPFYGEKFLYSVVTRGLFLAYAQPGWHQQLHRCYGFKLYNRIFDYAFDVVVNPVERLLQLVTMLYKFSHLSSDEWRDLYHMEADSIEYNYDHYFSGAYLKCLEQYQ